MIEFGCVGLLILTAVAKLLAVNSNQEIMRTRNPLLPFENHAVYLLVALVELLVAHRVLFSRSEFIRVGCLIWLALAFAMYRMASWFAGIQEPCACLGTGFEGFSWVNENLSAATKLVFGLFATFVFLRVLLDFRNLSMSLKTILKPKK
jgi:hypothetical protein